MPASSEPSVNALLLRAHVRAIRIGAGLVVAVTLSWVIIHWPLAGRAGTIRAAAYTVQLALNLFALWFVARGRRVGALRTLAWLICAEVIAAASLIAIAAEPAAAWETTLWMQLVVLGSASLMPWTGRWQSGLAILATAAVALVLALAPPTAITITLSVAIRLVAAVAIAGAISVVVAHLRERDRERIIVSTEEQSRGEVLSRMSSGIAHQFNNILGAILSNAELLRDEPGHPGSRQRLAAIEDAIRRGRTLTKALQRFTPHGAVTLHPVEPATILEEAAALIRVSLPPTVRFDVAAAGGLPRVAADADHLVHACFELALNAFHATEGRPEPTVRLEASSTATHLRLLVRDNGKGMDAATVSRAREPFFSTGPMWQRAGLGLASVRWVAEAHHGQLVVESEPGRGSTIGLEIPILAAPAAPPRPLPTEQRTALVVDDESTIRQPLIRVLARLGWDVREAADGATAIAVARTPQLAVHLVILDIVLPGGGVALLRALREAQPDARILVMSGFGPEGEAAKMLAEGAHGFLQKPFELAELRTAIDQVLGAA